jgi:hypothetical protein
LPAVLSIDEAIPSNLTASLDLTGLSGDQLRAASDGWYVVLQLGGATHRLWLTAEPVKPVTYGVNLLLDDAFETRARAAERLWRAFNNLPLGPALDRLTPKQRAGHVTTLRALDGRLDGASYRAIAEVLFGAALIPERGWKTHDLRSRTIRLVNLGLRMMLGGYRDLLRPRPKRR